MRIRWPTGGHVAEQLARHLAAEERDAAPQPDILGIHEASRRRRLAPHGSVGGRAAAQRVIGLFRPPRHRRVLDVLRAPGLDERDPSDGLGVREAEADPAARALAACLQARLPAEPPSRRRRTLPGSRGEVPDRSLHRTPAARRPTRCPTRCRASTNRRGRGCAAGPRVPRGSCRHKRESRSSSQSPNSQETPR